MEKLKGLLAKHQTTIVSIGIIVLLIIASIRVYKEYLIMKLSSRYKDIFAADLAEFDAVDRILFESKMKEFLSELSIKRLHGMNSLSDSEWVKIKAKL